MGLGIKTALLRPFEPLFLYRLPNWRLRRFNDPSQYGESLLLNKLVRKCRGFPEFFVDVGANDGFLHSNSFFFLYQGWRGILIEPHPGVFQSLSKRYANQSHVRCINSACADRSGTAPLFFGADGQAAEFSTMSTDDTPEYRRTRTSESVVVPVRTLTEILTDCRCPNDFGVLSIDTEGFDFEVLQGLDFVRYRPRIIITENYATKDQRKSELLSSTGYKLKHRRGVNTIWVDSAM